MSTISKLNGVYFRYKLRMKSIISKVKNFPGLSPSPLDNSPSSPKVRSRRVFLKAHEESKETDTICIMVGFRPLIHYDAFSIGQYVVNLLEYRDLPDSIRGWL